MSPEEREGNDTLVTLIAKYLEAEQSWQYLDRSTLTDEYPELADSLRELFANDDRLQDAPNLNGWRLPSKSMKSTAREAPITLTA